MDRIGSTHPSDAIAVRNLLLAATQRAFCYAATTTTTAATKSSELQQQRQQQQQQQQNHRNFNNNNNRHATRYRYNFEDFDDDFDFDEDNTGQLWIIRRGDRSWRQLFFSLILPYILPRFSKLIKFQGKSSQSVGWNEIERYEWTLWSVPKGRNGIIYTQYHCRLWFRYLLSKWARLQQRQNTTASAPLQTTRPSMFDIYDRMLRVNTLIGS